MDRLPNATLRRLFLQRHLLDTSPAGPVTRDRLDQIISDLGFVQVDTISTLEQAHHHILFTRANGYRKSLLKNLLEKRRSLFEHWTHDASVIPMTFYPYWKPRFERSRQRIRDAKHWQERFGGRMDQVLDEVRAHVTDNGPTRSRDLTPNDVEERQAWWGWTPSKTALEYLWRTGEFAVAGRDGFQKRFDLAHRVIPADHHDAEPEDVIDWACREALSRLGVATHGELAGFFDSISPGDAEAWCAEAGSNTLRPVEIEHADGSVRQVWARPDIFEISRTLGEPPARVRFLSPFDPMIRDRNRLQRYFGFDYRFEAFVPGPKRVFGYYVLPMLERDRLIGRIELKAHRDKGRLEVRGFWLEPKIRPAKDRMARIDTEIERWRVFCELETVEWTASKP